jgi:hypothetical protein
MGITALINVVFARGRRSQNGVIVRYGAPGIVEVTDKMQIGRKWAARDGKAVENSSKPLQETQAHVPQD